MGWVRCQETHEGFENDPGDRQECVQSTPEYLLKKGGRLSTYRYIYWRYYIILIKYILCRIVSMGVGPFTYSSALRTVGRGRLERFDLACALLPCSLVKN